MHFPRLSKPPKVYVDAKILNVHDPTLEREAYVGYVVEGSNRNGATRVDATESDDAEVLAILFALEELKEQLKRFTIVCDHESVVSEAKKTIAKNPSELMKKLRETLKKNPTIGLEVLKANPAHGVVTEYVNSLKVGPEEGLDARGVGAAPEVPDQRNSRGVDPQVHLPPFDPRSLGDPCGLQDSCVSPVRRWRCEWLGVIQIAENYLRFLP